MGKVGDKINDINNKYEKERALNSGKTVEEYQKEKVKVKK